MVAAGLYSFAGFQFSKHHLDVKVKRGFSWSEQVGIAIACLIESDKRNLVDWMKEVKSPFFEPRPVVTGAFRFWRLLLAFANALLKKLIAMRLMKMRATMTILVERINYLEKQGLCRSLRRML